MKQRTILTAILVDPMGTLHETTEEEIDRHKKTFRDALKPHRVKFYEPKHAGGGQHGIKPGTDLIVFDFGGMMMGSGDLILSNCREIIRWCQDHPSGLVIVISSFTYKHYLEHELEDMGLKLPNLVSFSEVDYEVPEWFLK